MIRKLSEVFSWFRIFIWILVLRWSTKKIRSLCRLKDKNPHLARKIYEGICSCSENYIGETKRNVEKRCNEHDNRNKDSEPAKHLRKFPCHKFDWKILLTAPANAKLRKILESSMIALKQPSWNKQLDFDLLTLFRNGVRSSVTNFYCFYFRWFNYCICFVT